MVKLAEINIDPGYTEPISEDVGLCYGFVKGNSPVFPCLSDLYKWFWDMPDVRVQCANITNEGIVLVPTRFYVAIRQCVIDRVLYSKGEIIKTMEMTPLVFRREKV